MYTLSLVMFVTSHKMKKKVESAVMESLKEIENVMKVEITQKDAMQERKCNHRSPLGLCSKQ